MGLIFESRVLKEQIVTVLKILHIELTTMFLHIPDTEKKESIFFTKSSLQLHRK